MERFQEWYGQHYKASVLVSGGGKKEGGRILLLLFPFPDKTRKEEKFSKIQIWVLNKYPTVF